MKYMDSSLFTKGMRALRIGLSSFFHLMPLGEETVSVATMDPAWLQAPDRAAEYIQQKIEKCHATKHALMCSIAILPKLHQMQRGLNDLRAKTGRLDISTDEDRAWAREQAQALMGIATKIDSAEEKYNRLTDGGWPILSLVKNANLRLLSESYCLAEDVAETLALSASEEFVNSIKSDLRRIHGEA